MNKILTSLLFFILTLTVFSIEIMPFQNIQPNMRGYYLTVLEDQKIEKINIKVIGKVKDENSLNKLLLVKSFDNLGIRGKTIAEGMSGSPVYFDEKLAGAISYRYGDSKSDIAIVTPIKLIAENIQNFDENYKKDISIKPGTSISLTPCIGDFTLDNIGTLTAIKDDKFFALGHPLNNKGDISYFLTKSEIEYVFEGDNSFKIGSGTKYLGAANYDGFRGIKGEFNTTLSGIDIDININSDDKQNNYQLTFVDDINAMNLYLETVIKSAIIDSINSFGYYVANYNFKMYNDDELIYENGDYIFYDDGMIESLFGIINDDILKIVNNPFEKLEIDSLRIDVELNKDKKVVYLKDLLISRKVFTIGENIYLNLFYLIYKNGFEERKISIEIPNDFKVGSCIISVIDKQHTLNKRENFENFNEFIKHYRSRMKNNQLKIEIKNESENRTLEKIVDFDKFIISDKIFSKNIIVDSYRASNKE